MSEASEKGCYHLEYSFDVINGMETNARCNICNSALTLDELHEAAANVTKIYARAAQLQAAGQGEAAQLVTDMQEHLKLVSRKNIATKTAIELQKATEKSNEALLPLLQKYNVPTEVMLQMSMGDSSALADALVTRKALPS